MYAVLFRGLISYGPDTIDQYPARGRATSITSSMAISRHSLALLRACRERVFRYAAVEKQ
jgi:hypothetical protein